MVPIQSSVIASASLALRRALYGWGMSDRPLSLAAVVLAAGAARRYSDELGAKLLANLDGEPLLTNVLTAVRAARPTATVVVLGHGSAQIEARIEWRDESRVTNPNPDDGLSSSIQVGIDALIAMQADFDGVFIVLGDQPRLQPAVLRALEDAAAHARPADRPLVVPRYETPGSRNPVLLLRPAWTLVNSLSGDNGFGRLIEERPDMVLSVPVPGDMPDVDRPSDLARLADDAGS
jgi:molybdenum cofactor cytidylyltransferase